MVAALICACAWLTMFPARAETVVDGREIADEEQGANWLSSGRTYAEHHYSPLTHIHTGNVGQLGLAWFLDLAGERTLQATPLAIDGVLYFSGANGKAYAVDAKSGTQLMQRVTIQGRPYLIFSDNSGAIGKSPDACESGKPGHGFAWIIDLSDEKNPRTVSRLMLEVADPARCPQVSRDPTVGGYGSVACSVDHDEEGKLLACGYFEGGLRVFDIRDPAHPREIAYYKPPARRMESRPGSLFRFLSGPQARDHTADAVIVAPKFRKNGAEIWFTSTDNGFKVVRFSDRFKALHPDLFRH